VRDPGKLGPVPFVNLCIGTEILEGDVEVEREEL